MQHEHHNHSCHQESTNHNEHDKHAGHSPAMFRERFWLSLLLTIPVVLYSHMIQEWFGFTMPEFPGYQWVPLVLGTVIFWYGGMVFIKSAKSEIKARRPGMMTLISLAIVTSYVYSVLTTLFLEGTEFFWELATLIVIMLLGHWIEMKSIMSAQSALKELAKLLPDMAELLDGRKVALSELTLGDKILIRPGSKIPADGIVIEGRSDVNESMLTGESAYLKKELGSEVIAGTVNGSGSLKVEISRIGEKTMLAGIMRLVKEAQNSKSKAQVLADKAAFYLTFVAIFASIATLLGWLIAGQSFAFALERTVTVLIIACPHALGLAIPLVTSISTTLGARNGLLVKQKMALESARNIDVVLFDKTGTLTKGEHGITDILTTNGKTEDAILSLAAATETESEHVIGKAIVRRAFEDQMHIPKATGFNSIPGHGVQATVENKSVMAGGPNLLESLGMTSPEEWAETIKRFGKEGKTIIYVLEEKKVIGALALADLIRSESYKAIKQLKSAGIRVAMLTGDSKDVAKYVADMLNIDEYFAEVLPEHKAEKVKQLQIDGSKVAMVGDGVNDAPALTQADLGVAIGAGTDVAVESAGIVLVKNNPLDIPKIITLSRATYRKMIQNLWWASGYNIIAIPLAAGAFAPFGLILPPAIGALLMSMSTIVVAMNAQLLRKLDLSK
jgi:P-type Cu2+ transporter